METVAVVPINIPDLTLTYNYDLLGLFSVSKSPFIISLSLFLIKPLKAVDINHFITLISPQYDAMDGCFFSNHSIPFGSMT